MDGSGCRAKVKVTESQEGQVQVQGTGIRYRDKVRFRDHGFR